MKGENGSIPAFARDILQTLEGAGHEAYCVGGCVRDSLLGRTPGDWDITTSARPEETIKEGWAKRRRQAHGKD